MDNGRGLQASNGATHRMCAVGLATITAKDLSYEQPVHAVVNCIPYLLIIAVLPLVVAIEFSNDNDSPFGHLSHAKVGGDLLGASVRED